MKKRMFCVVVALILVLPLLPGTVQAAAIVDSGTCGDHLTWTLDNDGTLTISGSGRMALFLPWLPISPSIKNVVIEAGVTNIGNEAFAWFENLKSITIPDSVTAIGTSAFEKCYGLTEVRIPDSVTYIGSWAFTDCDSLTDVRIPNRVTAIENCTFASCASLKSVSIPNGVASIGYAAFGECSSLTDVYYGGSQAEWSSIEIGDSNDVLSTATIHYSSYENSVSPDTSGGITIFVHGNPIIWTDAVPFIDENSRTMVPLRAVAEAMALEVSWDARNREASFRNGTKTIYFPIGSSTARTGDGKTIQMDTAAVIVNDRTFAPVRYLAEYFGYKVDWDGAKRSIMIG